MSIEKIQEQLEYLSDKIDLINNNLQFNINMFLAIIGVALVISGGALMILVKNIVNKRVNDELDKIDIRIENITRKIIREELEEFKKREVDNKIDKSRIINNCIANQEGFVLDARQGKEILDYVKSLNTVDGTICDRIEQLWDEINNTPNITQKEKDSKQEEIYGYIRQARRNGKKFPDYISRRF